MSNQNGFVPILDENELQRVAVAAALNATTQDDKKDAVRALADVLEFLKRDF